MDPWHVDPWHVDPWHVDPWHVDPFPLWSSWGLSLLLALRVMHVMHVLRGRARGREPCWLPLR